MQVVLAKHQHVFETPKGLLPSKGNHANNIPLFLRYQQPNGFPYRYPFSQKNEIEKIIQELQH